MAAQDWMNSPLGRLQLVVDETGVREINIATPAESPVDTDDLRTEARLLRELHAQLTRYFAKADSVFSIPLQLKGTNFQRRVWQALLTIPPGQVRTYGRLAQQLQSSARVVGTACRANPISIVVPCVIVSFPRRAWEDMAGRHQVDDLRLSAGYWSMKGSRWPN